jgi:hypothetical protein
MATPSDAAIAWSDSISDASREIDETAAMGADLRRACATPTARLARRRRSVSLPPRRHNEGNHRDVWRRHLHDHQRRGLADLRRRGGFDRQSQQSQRCRPACCPESIEGEKERTQFVFILESA